MSSTTRIILVLTSIATTAACSQTTETVCTLEARPALTVDVRDSVTNANAANGARIIAQSGTFADTVDVVGDGEFPAALAYEQAGVYVVTVEKEGYQSWSQDGIQVGQDACHVITVNVAARLQH